MKEKTFQCDVLVVGVGLAGSRAANEAARGGAGVIIVGKSGAVASTEVMGFNIAVRPEDSAQTYYEDLLRGGNYINNKELAWVQAEESRGQVPYLESLGFEFDKCEDGTYHAQHPIGSTCPRLIHQKAISGIKALSLIRKDNAERGVMEHMDVMITDLIRIDGRVVGAVGLDLVDGAFVTYQAGAVVLSTGGCGRMYPVSTYPEGIVGDGYAIAYRAGAELVDMEFLQYEPCCFVCPEKIMGMPIPTTMMMKGAKLLNGEGNTFIENYGLSEENVQKGELSRAMAAEIAAGRGLAHGGVLYDLRMLPEDMVKIEHCIFYDPALAAGIDIWKEPPEVAPAAHSCLGGVRIGTRAQSTVPGLYASGEAAGGVHGANRLGGSSGAEVLTFGAISGRNAVRWAKREAEAVSDEAFTQAVEAKKQRCGELSGLNGAIPVSELTDRLRLLVHEKVGILRCEKDLRDASAELNKVEAAMRDARVNCTADLKDIFQLENMILNARMQVMCSLLREESRGVFYRTDYPERDDAQWIKNNIVSCTEGTMTVKTVPCQ